MNKAISWYPGHMLKAKKELTAELKNIDLIIEIIDSRCPFSSHNMMLDELTKNKLKLLVFSKEDFVEKTMLQKVMNQFEKNSYNVISANLKQKNDQIKVLNKINSITQELINKYKQKGINKVVRATVIGMPNVGKSTFINFLSEKNKVIIANKPGVTKRQSWISINEMFEIMDTPGILVPKIQDITTGYKLVLCQLIKDEVVNLDDVCIFLLDYLFANYKQRLIDRYNIEIDFTQIDYEQLFQKIGEKSGCLLKGGIVDDQRVVKLVINDYRTQKFGKIILE